MNNEWLKPEEYVMGAVVGGAFFLFLGWWALLTAALCALLWRCGGISGGNKLFRRLGVPTVLCTAFVFSHGMPFALASISAVLSFAVLSLGYGIPDATDEGSHIGRFWLRILHDYQEADFMSRFTIGILLGLSFFPLCLNNVLFYVIGCCILCLGMPIVEEAVE